MQSRGRVRLEGRKQHDSTRLVLKTPSLKLMKTHPTSRQSNEEETSSYLKHQRTRQHHVDLVAGGEATKASYGNMDSRVFEQTHIFDVQ